MRHCLWWLGHSWRRYRCWSTACRHAWILTVAGCCAESHWCRLLHLWWHRSLTHWCLCWLRRHCRRSRRSRRCSGGLRFCAWIHQYFIEEIIHVAVIDREKSSGLICLGRRLWCRGWSRSRSAHRRRAETARRSHSESRRRSGCWCWWHPWCSPHRRSHAGHSTHSRRSRHRWRLRHRRWCLRLRCGCGSSYRSWSSGLLIDGNRRFFYSNLSEDLVDRIIVELEHPIATLGSR